MGLAVDWWNEARRSGKMVAGAAEYPDYRTFKTNVFLDLKYQFGGATLAYYMEWLNKDVDVRGRDEYDDRGASPTRTWSAASARSRPLSDGVTMRLTKRIAVTTQLALVLAALAPMTRGRGQPRRRYTCSTSRPPTRRSRPACPRR